jgi:hypothetical protein
MVIFRWIILNMRNFLNKILEKLKAHIFSPVTFFRESCHLWDNVKIYGGARLATDNNKARALCMLDN